jgi:hypothetical protein
MSDRECVLRQRDCFRFRERESHLWIVLSDPEQDPANVLLVNVTTLTSRKDQTCILRADCHPEVTHDSCIYYGKARVYSAPLLTSLLGRDVIRLCDPLDVGVFTRVWMGAILSPHTTRPHSSILLAQGI